MMKLQSILTLPLLRKEMGVKMERGGDMKGEVRERDKRIEKDWS